MSVLFSVPKKAFRKAWQRNLLKRRMRESYRTRKHELLAAALAAGVRIDMALICFPPGVKEAKKTATTIDMPDFKTIDDAIAKILAKILEKVSERS